MAKLQRNFIKGRMNKSLDERLVPNGEYIDALNVRVGSTELSEVGVIENSKGNSRLTTLSYITGSPPDNYPLSADAKCIGAYQDSANETIYWFVTDPSHTGPQATGKLDLIVSYNTNDSSVTYHVTSVDDGGGVNTTLNFNSQYLITGVDKVDDLLFFTDNFNQPRVINVTKDYPSPVSDVDDPILGEQLLVIKKPPINSPTFKLVKSGAEENFIKDRFICFAYRYRYEDDMYSATSQFSNVAFDPSLFEYDYGTFLNEGMVNKFDSVEITVNTGSSLVVGIDLLFKEASNPVIRVIEKLNKEELGISDNQDYTYEFSNNKIYSILDDNEILRLYDNVPLKAKAQTIMGSRIVYGNYVEGYDVSETKMEYEVTLESESITEINLPTSTTNGFYDIMSTGLSPSKPNSVLLIDLIDVLSVGGVGLESGDEIFFSFRFQHNSFETVGGATVITETGSKTVSFRYTLQRDYPFLQTLLLDPDFISKIGSNASVKSILDNPCTGLTLTDLINCEIQSSKIDSSANVYSKVGSGISQSSPIQGLLDPNVYTGTVPSPSSFTTQIAIQLPASKFLKDATTGDFVGEYYEITFSEASYIKGSGKRSLHSNRDYEVGIIYMDDFNRSTTVLVSPNNIIHIPCANSENKNKLKVEIPSTQIPPSWAKRYKFAVKQDKDLYETIYSDFFFFDPVTGITYLLLEGENAQKVEEGDILTIKTDTAGAVDRCIKSTVLKKEAKERDFLPVVSNSGNQVLLPSGVYIEIKTNNVDIGSLETTTFVSTVDFEAKTGGDGGIVTSPGFPLVQVPINFTGDDSSPTFIDESLSEGDEIYFELRFSRHANQGSLCPRRIYSLSQKYKVNQDYTSFKSWWDGDNIKDTLGNGTEDLQILPSGGLVPVTTDPFLSQIPPYTDFLIYDNTLASTITDIPFSPQYNYFRFYNDPVSNKKYLLVRSSNQACFGRFQSAIYVSIRIVKGTGIVVFETQPQDAAPDIWYESSVSYPITGGFHTGNVQNQTAIQPAIITTAFHNCFSFGNGVESFKIRDSITRSTFGLGNRVSGVLKGEDFKEVHRFADLTYSGTYGYNINNLNEFNLGLLNFKALEPSFGLIQKIFARKTDILVLQEDKISYVLAGKNLLSDSAAGGVITSAPDVLGTQIARMEEYGIGANAESFAEYGFEKYFTDSKRGVVIQLKGSAYSNEQLNVISGLGMSSWFRNLFIENPNTQKLGGYDPYSKEYVLTSNSILLPMEEEEVEAGVKKTVLATLEAPVSYTVDLGVYVGNATLTYNVKSIRNEFLLNVEYNSIDYGTPLTTLTSGTVTIPKAEVEPRRAVLSVTSVTASSSSRIEIDVQLSRPNAPTINIFQVCISDNNDSTKTIHNEYRWTSGAFVSPLQSEFLSLVEGTDSPLVSQYNKITSLQGGGVIPIDGATVEIISKKYQSDNFDFDNTVNNFGFLRSNTLYSNTPTDITNLIAASTSIAPTGSGSVFSGSFTMPTSTDQYLYLIYDYRKPVAITLCYSNTSADDACCTCGTSATYYIDAPIFEQSTAVYTTAALTTKAADGWYSYQGAYRKQTSGIFETPILCSACNLSCGTSLVMSTLTGCYNVIADLGSATGSVVIDIDFKTLPDGIKVVYDGVTYNSVYSPNFGYLNSTGTEPLYAGITAFDCGISGTTYSPLIDYQFNGNGFNPTGQIKNITIDPASVSLQPSGLGTCKMIIPKTSASPSIAEITIISPCDSAEIEIDVFCPTALTAFTTTRNAPEATSISGLCTSVTPTSFYNVPVGGTAGNPGLGDIIYQDANGIVTSITACVP